MRRSCMSRLIFLAAALRPLLLLAVGEVTGRELNSTQHHYYMSSPTTTVTGSSPGGLVNQRLGGRFRASYYPSISSSVSSGGGAGSISGVTTPSPGGANPVWVVWGRQGTPYEEQKYQDPKDFYQYATVAGDTSKLLTTGSSNNNNYYDDYYTANSVVPYETSASAPSITTFMVPESYEMDEDVDFLTGAQLKGLMKTRRTGLESFAGLLSLKGFKLSLIGFFYMFRGLIIFAWKFLPWIFLLMVALLFLPIPIITIPAAAGRTLSEGIALNLTDFSTAASALMDQLAASEQCVERIACDIRRRNRNSWFNPTLKSVIHKYKSHLPGPFQRMARAYLQQRKCRQYSCSFYDKT